jgi:DamX protein
MFMKNKMLLMVLMLTLVGCTEIKDAFRKTSQAQQSPSCVSNIYLKSYGCSLAKIQKSADSGDADAQYALGYMYFYGIGTAPNLSKARYWIQKSASQGQMLAEKALITFQTLSNKNSPGLRQTAVQPVSSIQARPNTKMNAVPKSNVSDQSSNSSIHPWSDNPKALAKASSATQAKGVSSHQVISAQTGFSLQLINSHSPAALQAFINSNRLGPAAKIYSQRNLNGASYILVYGYYNSADQARDALNHLPPQLKQMGPWVRSLQGLTLYS